MVAPAFLPARSQRLESRTVQSSRVPHDCSQTRRTVRIVPGAALAGDQAERERFLAALLRSVREQAVEEYEVVLVVEARSLSAEGASFFDLLDRLLPALDRRGTLRLRFASEAARACA